MVFTHGYHHWDGVGGTGACLRIMHASGIVNLQSRTIALVCARPGAAPAPYASLPIHSHAPLQVLSNVASRLAVMHAAGYVHRDLKPANVMWLPRENRWTVIGFGCMARIGAVSPVSFTLAYAAPEVVRAREAGAACLEVTAALDAWSLGVIAFELLTGAPAFNFLTKGRAKVRLISVTQPLCHNHHNHDHRI